MEVRLDDTLHEVRRQMQQANGVGEKLERRIDDTWREIVKASQNYDSRSMTEMSPPDLERPGPSAAPWLF